MKATVQYGDLRGVVAVDIFGMHKLKELAESFKVDTKRYDVIGLDINGVDQQSIAFIAIDRNKTTQAKEHIVKIATGDLEDLKQVFERLHLILMERYKQEYLQSEIDEEIDLTEED